MLSHNSVNDNRENNPDTDILHLKGVTKSVLSGEQPLLILQAVELQIKLGESVAITGSSGSGKSTLLGIMAGLDSASMGSVRLLGEELSGLNEDQRAAVRARGVGFVFQDFQLLDGLTALENVMLPLELKRQPQARQEAERLLAAVGLAGRLSHYPNQLSGGEQQRVALARAFAGQPQILFADEPTGNLDRQTGEQIEALLFKLNSEYRTTLVLVTHDPKLAARCNRTVQLEAGQLV